MSTLSSLRSSWQSHKAAYAADAEDDRPIDSYVVLMGVWAALAGAVALTARAKSARLPTSATDLVVLALATQKLSRLTAKDSVTSPVRVPFTKFAGTSGDAELKEQTRGVGLQHAVGELLTCPMCLGVWVATGLVGGRAVAPRATRLFTTVFAAVGAADYLHQGYAALQRVNDSG